MSFSQLTVNCHQWTVSKLSFFSHSILRSSRTQIRIRPMTLRTWLMSWQRAWVTADRKWILTPSVSSPPPNPDSGEWLPKGRYSTVVAVFGNEYKRYIERWKKKTHGIYSKHFHVGFTLAIANITSIQGILTISDLCMSTNFEVVR